jgi:F-type H+-transporting ATPase subunit a
MSDSAELIGHVKDTDGIVSPHAFHFPFGKELPIPQPFGEHFPITKFMVLELVAAVLMLLIFIPLARRVATGKPLKGKFWNMFEVMLVFLRDEVTRPAIGGHKADRFLPYVWNAFFFILFCNLLGLLPWAGSPTGSLSVTGALAAIAFATAVGAGVKEFGPVGFWIGQVPHMELPWVLAIFLKPMIFVIEIMGLCIRHFVLAVRLLANMFAGHLVVGVIVGFIALSANSIAWYGVMPVSVLGATALNMLELFVAFLQAYIFAFLSALFIGMAVHRH